MRESGDHQSSVLKNPAGCVIGLASLNEEKADYKAADSLNKKVVKMAMREAEKDRRNKRYRQQKSNVTLTPEKDERAKKSKTEHQLFHESRRENF